MSLKKRVIGREKEGKKKIIKKKKITVQGKDDGMDEVREGEDIDDEGQD